MRRNKLEWTVFAMSLGMVAATVGVLTYEAISSTSKPAQLTVRLGEPSAVKGEWQVPITIENSGDETAEGATVVVTLEKADVELESVRLRVPFVPRHSSRTGTAVFQREPSCCDLVGRVVAFETP